MQLGQACLSPVVRQQWLCSRLCLHCGKILPQSTKTSGSTVGLGIIDTKVARQAGISLVPLESNILICMLDGESRATIVKTNTFKFFTSPSTAEVLAYPWLHQHNKFGYGYGDFFFFFSNPCSPQLCPAGIIQPSSSPLSAGFHFVAKKDKTLGTCIGFRG